MLPSMLKFLSTAKLAVKKSREAMAAANKEGSNNRRTDTALTMALQFWAQAILDARFLIEQDDNDIDITDYNDFTRIIESVGDEDSMDDALRLVETALEEATDIATKLQDTRELVDITMHKANLRRSQARYVESFQLNEQALQMAAQFHGSIHDRTAVISENLYELYCDVGINPNSNFKALQHILRAMAVRLWLFEMDHPALQVTLEKVIDEFHQQDRRDCADVLENTCKWGLPIGAQVRLVQRFGAIPEHSIGICIGLDMDLQRSSQVRIMLCFNVDGKEAPPARWWREELSAEPSLWEGHHANEIKHCVCPKSSTVIFLTRCQFNRVAVCSSMPVVRFHDAGVSSVSSSDGQSGLLAFNGFQPHPSLWPWSSSNYAPL